MVVPWAEKDSQEFMAITPARTDLDRWVVFRQIGGFI